MCWIFLEYDNQKWTTKIVIVIYWITTLLIDTLSAIQNGRHFADENIQIHVLEWQSSYFDSNFIDILSNFQLIAD